MAQSVKPVTSPIADAWYPALDVITLAIGLTVSASFLIYEATTSRKSRSLYKELITGALASVFLGFGLSLFRPSGRHRGLVMFRYGSFGGCEEGLEAVVVGCWWSMEKRRWRGQEESRIGRFWGFIRCM
ncbi:hypothetical protein QQ045_021096 [Rhodiola kirilowii]